MAAINFSGLASGLDTRAIVDAILSVERQPLERIQDRRSLYSQQKATYEELRSKLTAFEGSLRDLALGRAFRGRTSATSDETIVRTTVGSGAETGAFDIDVTALAKAEKVKSDGFAASDDSVVIDEGLLTIQSGTNALISIDVSDSNGNRSLAAIRDEINDADAGVGASIIYDGTNYSLTVRAEETGTDNALVISDATNLNLGVGGDNQITDATDAEVKIDGFEITGQTNKITGVLEGVTFDLLAIGESTVEISQDSEAIVDAVDKLVSDYNEITAFFNEQFDRNDPGVLNGDATARSVQSRIQSLFVSGVDGVPLGGIRSLASLGVSFDGKTGEANLDKTDLRELLETRFDEVGDLFLASGNADNPQIRFLSATSKTLAGEYAVEITQAAEQAFIVGETATTKLNQDETLTITVGTDQVEVFLEKDFRLDDVYTEINRVFGEAGINATAKDDGSGKLRIETDAYGSEATLSVVSSRFATNKRSAGIGNQLKTDEGQDVAGTVGGFTATGNGQLLTVDAGQDAEGLNLRVTATDADITANSELFGNVNYTRGFVNSVLSDINRFTRSGDGTLEVSKDNLENQIEGLGDNIARIEDRLLARESQLLLSFSRAERAISALQSQQTTLGAIAGF